MNSSMVQPSETNTEAEREADGDDEGLEISLFILYIFFALLVPPTAETNFARVGGICTFLTLNSHKALLDVDIM